jgi:HKD family nuclease
MSFSIHLLANRDNDQPARDAVDLLLRKSDSAFFAVAYGTHPGLGLLSGAVKDFLGRGGRFRSILDVDRHFTDPDLIDDLCTTPGDVECRLYAPRIKRLSEGEQNRAFHSKIYYFEREGLSSAIIGSSNLSPGGLERNHECDLLLEGESSSQIFRNIQELLSSYWDNPAILLAKEFESFREQYAEAYKKAKVRSPRPGVSLEAPLPVDSDSIQALQDALDESKRGYGLAIASYLAGLFAGGKRLLVDVKAHTVRFTSDRGLLNKGNANEGFIQFDGVSERHLKQRDQVRRDAETLRDRLLSAFRELDTKDTVLLESRETANQFAHTFTVAFHQSSPVWASLRKLYGGRMARIESYVFPPGFEDMPKDAQIEFLKGYIHIRLRIALADRWPNGALRLAISVGNDKQIFATRLQSLLAEAMHCDEGDVNNNRRVEREILLRFRPELLPLPILLAPWQKLVVEDFANFNRTSFSHSDPSQLPLS